ncbi:GDP-mannose 4,6-dehydratase [Pelagibacteraceae bacterium]|nr:GDP-mannose 4,6-dehydratase [Pelagibacteraceae bacterium]
MKKILVTGGAGFIGHHFINYILENTDWEIVSIDRLDFSGNLNRINDIFENGNNKELARNRVRVVFHDLRAEINDFIASDLGEFDYIVHMAASSHVDRSISDPMSFVQDNVVATCNILNFAKNIKNLNKFIYFSTDEIFGPAPKEIKYKERDRYNSTNPYSATKAGGEELAVAFQNTYKMPIIVTHTMNVFGERQHPEKFIPMTIKNVRDNKKVFIHSNKEKTKAGSRHYIHANDVSSACKFLLTKNYEDLVKSNYDFGGAICPKFNIVGAIELDNLQLAQEIARAQNKELIYEFVDFHSSRPGHDLRYALDGDLMKKLGWEPSQEINKRIQQVVSWSLKNDRWLKY